VDDADARALLRRLFDAAVAAADPLRCVPPALPEPPRGRTVVVGAGKAAAAMAMAVERHWPALRPLSGVVVTRYGHAGDHRPLRIVVREASHPVPDAAGEAAARALLAAVDGLTADDLVLCLISGGGSALLPAPLPGLTLADKQALTRQLLACGAPIDEINCVRKHLSAIKGGRLAAAAWPAPVVTLAISDVPGDDPAAIASGPTVGDPTTAADARRILERYRIAVPPAVRAVLADASAETPKPDDPRFAGHRLRLIASNQMALEAAAACTKASGLAAFILGDGIEGEAREVARVHAAIARQIAARGQPVAAPCLLLSGGETTVTVRGDGRGGRNAEFALAAAIALKGTPGVWVLAADTDGIDGVEDNAGAFVTPDTLARARAAGRNPAADLERNDAHGFFAATGDLLVTGPTRTNVNDFRAILVAR
jgi:glycerate 2-kinase